MMLSEAVFRELVNGRWQGPLAIGLRGALAALEHPYAWTIRWRNGRFDRGSARPHRVRAPVISVGNLTVGGTGKTPFVAWLARWLIARQVGVTIISRGYGARKDQPNDEALELALRLPEVLQLQNPDRIAAAEEAIATNPGRVLILDDAFQHRRLARDLDIVLLDALEPFGYGHLLPRGLLREPVESLVRAQVVALSHSDAVDEARRREIEVRVRDCAPRALWLELTQQPGRLVSTSGQSLDREALRGRRVAAFCGIGNPAGFRHTLASCGLDVVGLLALPDHCQYRERDLARVTQWLKSLRDVNGVICTRKDLVKIPRQELVGKRLWALEVELKIVRGQAELETLLDPIVRQASSLPHS